MQLETSTVRNELPVHLPGGSFTVYGKCFQVHVSIRMFFVLINLHLFDVGAFYGPLLVTVVLITKNSVYRFFPSSGNSNKSKTGS